MRLRPGKLVLLFIDLELNRTNIDIATLSETQLLIGSGSIREEHYTFFWSRHPAGERMRHGVALLSATAWSHASSHASGTPETSPHFMSMSVPISQRCLTVLSVFAPTLMMWSNEKDEFYQLLSESLSTISKGDDVVLAGDFTARAGAGCDQWNGALGPHHGLGKIN